MLTKNYSIGELAKLLNVSRMTLIDWEKKGEIPKAHREKSGHNGRYFLENEAKEIYLFANTRNRY